MSDVVFITPNISNRIQHESTGTLLLATILNEKNVSCEVWNFAKFGDINNFEIFLENIIKSIKESNPKIVSFYTRCDVYHIDIKISEHIKKYFKDIYIVFGGPQADITAEETLKQIPYVDYICCGEGEKIIYPFFKSLLQKKPDISVDGLVYRTDLEIIKNPRPIMIDDLDTLPFIDYSIVDSTTLIEDKIFPIEVGRGCPFNCVFCSTKSFWGRKYRLKTSQRIFEEIKAVNRELGITKFNFLHDMFTFKRKNIIEICTLLKTLDFPIKWACSARLDCLDKELIDIMFEAGLAQIYFGIETGSPRMQKLINKRLNIENAEEILRYINDKGILITTSFIYGFPEETKEDISQTMSMISRLMLMEKMNVQTHLCAFLPKTDLTEMYKGFLTVAEKQSNVTGDYVVDECKDLIENYPELFEQLFEYKTELRNQLKHFETFVNVWSARKPIYNYVAELYTESKLFDMYCDFVNDNNDILENVKVFDADKASDKIFMNDNFLLRFSNDENYDIISDYVKLQRMLKSSVSEKNTSNMDVVSFDANCINNKALSIKEYTRGEYMVICNNGKFACFPKK